MPADIQLVIKEMYRKIVATAVGEADSGGADLLHQTALLHVDP